WGSGDGYRHRWRMAGGRPVLARMHAFAHRLAVGLRHFEHAAIAIEDFHELHRATGWVFANGVEGEPHPVLSEIGDDVLTELIDDARLTRWFDGLQRFHILAPRDDL